MTYSYCYGCVIYRSILSRCQKRASNLPGSQHLAPEMAGKCLLWLDSEPQSVQENGCKDGKQPCWRLSGLKGLMGEQGCERRERGRRFGTLESCCFWFSNFDGNPALDHCRGPLKPQIGADWNPGRNPIVPKTKSDPFVAGFIFLDPTCKDFCCCVQVDRVQSDSGRCCPETPTTSLEIQN